MKQNIQASTNFFPAFILLKIHIQQPIQTVFIGCSLLMSLSCRGIDRQEQALTSAGKNRAELKKTLAHYSTDRSDSLKYRAACFLIENLPGNYTLDTLSVAVNQPYIALCKFN
jgi:hypothetical protein